MVSSNRGKRSLAIEMSLSVMLLAAIGGLHVAGDRLVSMNPAPATASDMPLDAVATPIPVDSASTSVPVDAISDSDIVDVLEAYVPEIRTASALSTDEVPESVPVDGISTLVSVDTMSSSETGSTRFNEEISVQTAKSDPVVAQPPASTPAIAEGTVRLTLSGTAKAVDATAVEIRGIRIRLDGISAPIPNDICLSEDGVALDCAKWAREAVGLLVDGMDLSCDMTLSTRDRHGSCSLDPGDGSRMDVSDWAVSSGVARAADDDPRRAAIQEIARIAGFGIWSATLDADESPDL
jgi:endonuclease YncB( thermonuclease family)